MNISRRSLIAGAAAGGCAHGTERTRRERT